MNYRVLGFVTFLIVLANLFNLGSVFYFMCTGHSPFRAETTMGVLNRISNDTPRKIRKINPDVPAWLKPGRAKGLRRVKWESGLAKRTTPHPS